ncbi:MAG: response regulator [Microcoleaceae cyanobacterium]
MLATENIDNLSLISQLITTSQKQFTGSLKVEANGINHSNQWNIYFFRGRIIWACGGENSRRQLRQHIVRYQIKINPISLDRFQVSHNSCWIYELLCSLLQEKQISREKFETIVKSIVSEILFDILQQENQPQVICEIEPNIKINTLKWPRFLIDTQTIIKKAEENWYNWSHAGLKYLSPNFGLVLSEPEQLKQQISAILHTKLATLINSQRTLRDIASKIKLDQFRLAKFLFPQIHKGLIKLVKLPDLPLIFPSLQRANLQSYQQKKSSLEKKIKPLIACVDDSPIVCHQMKQIISANGLDFIGINSPVKAIITLIERKPDLIFLDLVMPIANGYEICAQIRRISEFKKTPVVILTSSNRVTNRVRATMVGCSDYLTKPIQEKQVQEIVSKYLTGSSYLAQQPIPQTLRIQFS